MHKADIETREDILRLVRDFYTKVREDELLAPYFASISDWEHHMEKLTTFWESSIFMKTKYFGNPLDAHVKVDQEHDQSITQLHFGQWMNLWIETVDEIYEGEYASRAKNRARKMHTFLYMKIFEARQ
ncbi:MAG: group III truncated hemoglobin [Flavobacteriaceae bacterium]|nr:group III truncated hemoglobin [Flavobacteriaceae bacterium]